MRGMIYGVGVGPGDPELMTQKAVRLILENDVIAVPGNDARKASAYRIAAAAVPQIEGKEVIPVSMPMSRDRELVKTEHEKSAKTLEKILDGGKNVVYLTLGDPTIYCSFSYLQAILQKDGYRVEVVPGVTSFCAAAARLGIPLAEGDEKICVIPSGTVHDAPEDQDTWILMKSGRRICETKEMLNQSGRDVFAVENCGMQEEKIYRDVNEVPDDAGYFTLIVAKKNR